MTELDRAELTEVIEQAVEPFFQALSVDSLVMAEREACALIAERLGADAVAAAIRGQE